MAIKFSFKRNESKKFLIQEKRNIEEYMKGIAADTEEYAMFFEQWKAINSELEKMSWTYKLNKALPWLGLGVTAVGTIAVPITLGTLAYRNSEEQGKLKNGDIWREATKQTIHPQQPEIKTEK